MKRLGQKLITIHSSQKPEMEIHLNQKLHRVQSIQNESIVFSLFHFGRVVVLVPDGDDDDYDDDDDYSRVCGENSRCP